MKKMLVLPVLLAILFNPLSAAKPIFPDSKIKAVTVFMKGAMVTRVIDTRGLTGEQEIIIKGLPLKIDKKTIVVESKSVIEINSVNSSTELKSKLNQNEYNLINSQVLNLSDSISYYQSVIEVLNKEYAMIIDHQDFNDKEGRAVVDEVVKASQFYRKRLKEIVLEKLTKQKTKSGFQKQVDSLNVRSRGLVNKSQEYEMQVRIKLNVKGAVKDGIKLKYYLQDASWYPYYDLKVDKLTDGMQLLRKAYVSQNSNEDWIDVKLTLSNANPIENTLVPILMPMKFAGIREAMNGVAGDLLDEVAAGRSAGITIRGSRTDKTVYYIDGIKAKKDIAKNEFQMDQERQAIKQVKVEAVNSVQYVIEESFDVLTNGKEVDVLLEENKLDCEFEHYTIPLKSAKVFLRANIVDWYKLDLLEGNVNLFLSGTFKGTSYINPMLTEEKLSISLGVDPEVIVERKQLRDLYDKKFFGKNVEESLTYEISVKNNKSQIIDLKILDQIPISDNKDIKIELTQNESAELNKDDGQLTWELKMMPGADVKYRFGYKVQYPKEFNLIL